MDRKITELKNNIELIYKQNKNTPRIAFSFNYSLSEAEKVPGTYLMMARLFMQGTKNRTAQQIAEELDRYAIEFSSELKQDFLRFKFVCLNEDFSKALEIMSDIMKNTTFDDFDRELVKMEGEIIAELDSARGKVLDNYYKTIFEGHQYSHTYTKILENIKNIKKDDVKKSYEVFAKDSKKVIAFVGDLDYDNVLSQLNAEFGDLCPSSNNLPKLESPTLNEKKIVEIIKPDMNQAHLLQGWIVPTFEDEDCAPLVLLNIMLGASGLSSRLFLELRDKKGLAYVVRSSYETNALCANFSIYIATEPKNIQVSLDGFKEEIDKIKTTLVPLDELENAKTNLFGKWAFSRETNMQQAALDGRNAVIGIGVDYNERLAEKIKTVTQEDIKRCANKYFTENYVLSILKP